MAVIAEKPAGDTTIRPFTIETPEAELEDLRARIAATRWPTRELVDDRSQGVQPDRLKELVRYWQSFYDWRGEGREQAEQFSAVSRPISMDWTSISSMSAPRHENALPLIMTYGWPGSVFELLNVIGPLTDPTAHGGRADDAFHLVIPSIPGFGLLRETTSNRLEPPSGGGCLARVLMKRLNYDRYVSQGGDWGAIISDALGRQAPDGLLAIHVNRVECAHDVSSGRSAGSQKWRAGFRIACLRMRRLSLTRPGTSSTSHGFGYASDHVEYTAGDGRLRHPAGFSSRPRRLASTTKIADWV